MESITLTAPDISCDHCKATVEREVATLPGVHRVAVDVSAKQVSVTYDPSSTTLSAIESKMEEEGYPVDTGNLAT